MKNLYISLVLVVFIPLFGCSNDNFKEATAITNVSVIHPVTGLQKNQTVLFQNDQILSVSSSVDNLPNASEIIDGKDKFLIPGLWDMHVHLTYDDAFTESMPKLFLAHGITSVRDTGGLMEKMEPAGSIFSINPPVSLTLVMPCAKNNFGIDSVNASS